jgi:AcrR family transcriptional regulator
MARKREPAVSKRRTPRQARALDTLETIFEATARIIEREGADALTTNRIAERAGIAIGSLYAYFPNKQAILLAMARRELERTQSAIRAAIESADPNADIGHLAIRGLIRGFGGRKKVRRALLETFMAHGRHAELMQPVDNLTRLVLGDASGRLRGAADAMTEAQAFVLSRALAGVIRAATLEESPLVGTQTLEDEAVRLARAYVGALARAP